MHTLIFLCFGLFLGGDTFFYFIAVHGINKSFLGHTGLEVIFVAVTLLSMNLHSTSLQKKAFYCSFPVYV